MNLLNLDVGATDYEGEAAKRRKVLESLGVTEEHDVRQQAPAPTQNGLPPQGQQRQPEGLMFPDGAPQRPMTKGHQEYLESPMTAMLKRFAIPKAIYKQMYGANEEYLGQMADYKVKSEAYEAHQERLATSRFAQPYRSMLQNDDKDDDLQALEELAILQPKIYGPVLRDYQTNRLAPTPATYTEGKWQYDPNYSNGEGQDKGRYYLERQASDGSDKKVYGQPGFVPASFMPKADYLDQSVAKAQEEAWVHQGNAQGARGVIDRMETVGEENWTAGYAAKAGEFVKEVFGREDFVTGIRKEYQDIKVRNAISNLPPGVASDKDIELALSPWPNDTSNYGLIKEKLEAIERIENARYEYRTFEGSYIERNRGRNGLQSAWNETATAKRVAIDNEYVPQNINPETGEVYSWTLEPEEK